MEAIQLSFVTLPGVSTSYSLTIGSTNNAAKEVKIVSAKKYKRLKKKKKKKKRMKTVAVSPVFEQSEITKEVSSSVDEGRDPEELKKECYELAEKIDKHGDIRKGYKSLEDELSGCSEDDIDDPALMSKMHSKGVVRSANYV